MNFNHQFLLLFIVFSLVGCSENKVKKNPFEGMSKEKRMELSQNSMRSVLKKEQKQIRKYISRKGGDFIETGTGVHYFVYHKNNTGKRPVSGNTVVVRFVLTLLNGDTVENHWNRIDKISVEFDHKESGLHEVLKLLKTGEKAVIIIPSHRAHGLTGNDTNIPSLSTILYNLELIGIE